MTATSGLNALAHAVEALYARDRNPVLTLLAAEAVAALVGALPRLAAAPGDRDARARALYGAWLCGAALGGTTMALHHKLCHVLGGSFGLPHAETHAVMLPHAAAYNAAAAGALLAPVERGAGRGARRGGGSTTWPGGSARRGRCGISASRRATSTGRRTSRRRTPTGTRARWSATAIRALLAAAWAGEPPAA